MVTRPWLHDRGTALLVVVLLSGLGIIVRVSTTAEWAKADGAVAWMQALAYGGLGALAWRAGRAPEVERPVRIAWRLIGLAVATTLSGNVIAILSPASDGQPPPASTVAYLVAAALVLAALFRFPLAQRSRHDRVTAALDSSIVILGGVIAAWVVLIEPGVDAAISVDRLLLGSLGPLGGLVSLVGVTRVAVNASRESQPLAMTLLIVAMLGFFTASLGGACDLAASPQWGVEPSVFIALATSILAVAAHLQFHTPGWRAERTRERYGPLLVHARAILPYTAVAVGFWFPLDAARSGHFDQFVELVLSAAALTALIIGRQITVLEHRRRVAVALRASEARYRELLEHVPTVVYVSDYGPDGTWRYVSPRVEELLGFTSEEWISDRTLWWSRIHPEDRDRVLAEETETWSIPEGKRVVVEYRMLTRDGRVRWVRDEATVVRPQDGASPYWSGFLSDVTDRRSLEEQLQHQAFHDPLTGLANRAVFLDRTQHALSRSRRRATAIAVLFLDLDNFKNVNDGMGHAAGDELLVAVGARLMTSIRPGDTAARLGGDEFAVLLEDAQADGDALAVADRIHDALARPVTVQGRAIVIGASIGIARPAVRPEGAAELLRNADAAMYVAKRTGKSRSQLFQPEMHAAAVRRLELNVDMRRATELEEFAVHYQPIVSLDDGRLVGFEALIRWDHPTRGMVAPLEFITLAEETGQILVIGQMVLERACEDVRAWHAAAAGGPALTVSVNVSARQLQDESFVAVVADTLAASGLPPSSLTLEITESVVIADADVAIERLRELKSLGVRLAIDDFGTGYSSLGYLRRLPVDILKVDRSLIAGVDEDGEARALAEMIVHLGRTFGLRTVAEGVERPSQADVLLGIGFDLAQGYHFSRPVPADAVPGLLADAVRRPGTARSVRATASLRPI